MITIAEELVLLAVEDDGKIAYTAGSPEFAMALVGACLIELNLAGRIDADVDSVKVLSPAPTGIGVLDFVLDKISAGNSKSSRAWVRDLHSHYTELFRLTLRLLL